MEKTFKFSKNKMLSIEIDRFDEWDFFDFRLRWSRQEDYAGFNLFIEIAGIFFSLKICDTRQWNYDHKNWIEG